GPARTHPDAPEEVGVDHGPRGLRGPHSLEHGSPDGHAEADAGAWEQRERARQRVPGRERYPCDREAVDQPQPIRDDPAAAMRLEMPEEQGPTDGADADHCG